MILRSEQAATERAAVLRATAGDLAVAIKPVLAQLDRITSAPSAGVTSGAARSAPGSAVAPAVRTGSVREPRRPGDATARSSSRRESAGPARTTEGVSRTQQRIIDAGAFLEQLGITEPEPTQLAFLARLSASGGYWSNLISAMRSAGYIQPAPSLGLTDAARAIAGDPPVSTTAELHAHVIGVLKGAEKRLLQALIDVYPESLTYEELGDRAGVSTSGGYFSNSISALRSARVASPFRRGQNTIAAAAALFVLDEVRA